MKKGKEEEGKWCGACGTLHPESAYSKKQWKTRTWRRRCADCTASDRPLLQADPVETLGRDVAAVTPVGCGLYTKATPEMRRAMGAKEATSGKGKDGRLRETSIDSLPRKLKELSFSEEPKDVEDNKNSKSNSTEKADDDSSWQNDCPICFMKLPFEQNDIVYNSCCGKICCASCIVQVAKKNRTAMNSCFFCKTPPAAKGRPRFLRLQKRAKLKDPEAMTLMAFNYAIGRDVRKDEMKAIEYLEEAASLGHPHAMFLLGNHCRGGREEATPVPQDYGRARRLFLGAAEAGHVNARYELADMEVECGNFDDAKRHFLLAAALGHEKALVQLKHAFRQGSESFITKEELATAVKHYSEARKELEDEHRVKNRNVIDFMHQRMKSELGMS